MSQANGDPTSKDEGWLTLTRDMEPYERFRFIVRHVLEAALEDARRYATDERLFDGLDAEDPEALQEHLEELDRRLQDDDELGRVQAGFLCTAVDAALQDLGEQSRCYDQMLELAELAQHREADSP